MPSEFTLVVNAFAPGREIELPSQFAGRVSQIEQLCQALHARGECPLIHGDRGLGKSSLAFQGQRIAMGDLTLLEMLGMTDLGFGPNEEFIVLSITCSRETPSTRELLQRMLSAAENIELDPNSIGSWQLVDRTTTKKVSLKFFELGSAKKYEQRRKGKKDTSGMAIEDRLIRAVDDLTASFDQPALFVVDELDRVGDTSGLASFIKAAASKDLKFMLVGVGENVSDLIAEHASVARIISPILVPVMAPQELRQIIENATASVRSEGLNYRFNRAVQRKLVELAGGFPWFVHLLGKYALLAAFDEKSEEVTESHLARGIARCAEDRFAQQYLVLYRRVVGRSRHREMALRCLANWPRIEISADSAQEVLSYAGVGNPAEHIRYLKSETGEHVIIDCRGRGNRLVRFADPVFKLYVQNLCTPLNESAASEVDRALAAFKGDPNSS